MKFIMFFDEALNPGLWTILGLTLFQMGVHALFRLVERTTPGWRGLPCKHTWSGADGAMILLGFCAGTTFLTCMLPGYTGTFQQFLLANPIAIGVGSGLITYLLSGLAFRHLFVSQGEDFSDRWIGQHVLGIGVPCIIFFIQFVGP